MSFLKVEASHRVKGSKLMQLSVLIDWSRFKSILKQLGRSGYGPNGYDTICLLKALILQSWFNLSDPKLEDALRLRLDFILFTGLETLVPDETTLCRFRNKLTKLGLWEEIFAELNSQLVGHGLAVLPTDGAVVDATVVESAARPSKSIVGIVVDRVEDEHKDVLCTDVQLSKDPDARWLKKGKKNYFGYKAFIATDTSNGFIHNVAVLPANASEIKNLKAALGDLKPKRLYADKGYSCNENRNFLRSAGIKNGIMYKAARNTTLTRWQKLFNRIVSSKRYIIEQGFGTLKRIFGMNRAKYITIAKIKAEIIGKAIAFNLLKAVNLMSKLA